MNKTILCTSPMGAEMIRNAKFATYVPKIFSDFIFTPMPRDAEGFEFYEAQISLFKTLGFKEYGYYGSRRYLDYFRKIFHRLESSETIELWLEPSLNSHVHVIHLLTLLEGMPNLKGKLFINHTAEPVGVMNDRMLAEAKDNQVPVTPETFQEAARYWKAFRSHTPQKCVSLIGIVSDNFPVFNQILKRFLLQLPLAPTGLRLVDRQVLKYVDQGMEKTVYILGNILADQADDYHVLNEIVICDAIFALANAPKPAISGLPLKPSDYGSFSKENMAKRKNFFNSQPRLTAYGKALLKGGGCWFDENHIDYWWGGTHITNENNWSFDPATETLIKRG